MSETNPKPDPIARIEAALADLGVRMGRIEEHQEKHWTPQRAQSLTELETKYKALQDELNELKGRAHAEKEAKGRSALYDFLFGDLDDSDGDGADDGND